MGHLGSRLKAGECRGAGIGEKVKHRKLTVFLFYKLTRKRPVDRLLRKKTGMLETHRFKPESKTLILYAPNIRHRFQLFPVTSAA